jgi:hypothetical protein
MSALADISSTPPIEIILLPHTGDVKLIETLDLVRSRMAVSSTLACEARATAPGLLLTTSQTQPPRESQQCPTEDAL